MMGLDRKIIWLLLIICLIILLWLGLDHIFFPDLPVPAGTPPITK